MNNNADAFKGINNPNNDLSKALSPSTNKTKQVINAQPVVRPDVGNISDNEAPLYVIAWELYQRKLLPKGVTTPEQAVLIMLKGRELGIQPMTSLDLISFFNGKCSVSGQGLLALVYRVYGSTAIIPLETARDRAAVKYKRPEWPEYLISEFTIQDAIGAGLTSKDNWRMYPVNMLYWRAIANACRFAFPDIISGLYLTDEAE